MHLKRQEMPKNWPLPRKGSVYVVRPRSENYKGVPLLVAMRDVLGATKDRRETRKAIIGKKILVNNNPVYDEKEMLGLFDVISIVSSKVHYKVGLTKNGKFTLEKIAEKEASKKVSKVINKKKMKGGKTQINLLDGRNYLSELKCSIDDSVIINFKESKLEKSLPLKEGGKIVVFAGKHAGNRGKITKIDQKEKMAEMDSEDKKKINVLIKHLIVVE